MTMKAKLFNELMKSCKDIYRQNPSYLNWVFVEIDCNTKKITVSCATNAKACVTHKEIKTATSSFSFYTKPFSLGTVTALTDLTIKKINDVITACYNNIEIQLPTPNPEELYGDNPFLTIKGYKGDNDWKGGISVSSEYLKDIVNSLPKDQIVDLSFIPLKSSASLMFEISTPVGVEKRILAPVLKQKIDE